MPDPLSQALRDWQNFYILVGGAAAALAGLMFVAISLGSRLITQEDIPALRVFASPTLIHFISVLATSAVVLIPIVTRASLGVVLLLAGVVGLVWTLSTQPPMRRSDRAGDVGPRDWIWYLTTPSAAYLLYVGTGIALLGGTRQALVGLAFGSFLLLVTGIRNAWDMVVFVAPKPTATPSRERSAERPDAASPRVDRVDADRPAADRPAVERPAVEHPAVERPAVERPAVERPAVERAAPSNGPPAAAERPPDPTTSLALPSSDQAEVTRLIHDAGLPSGDFTWALQPNRYALIGPLVSALVHTRTGGYFRFEFTGDASGRNRMSVFSPGKGAPEVAKEAASWEEQLDQVRVWLKSLSEVRR